ncbi:hypothetical protein F5887DRAFT_905459 [Amanita rubescens]|nr:hypothetical protein F5887DRAFT_905459 [Amanita rubescens]
MTQEKIIPNGEHRRAQQPIPTPRYRHATPSGPWPFLDVRDSVSPIEVRPKQGRCKHNKETMSCNDCLEGYPQSLFPNWTRAQQDKSGIHEVARQKHACSMQYVEMAIDQKGCPFSKPEVIHVDGGDYESGAEELRQVRARKAMARAIFVDGISGPALKMLGTIYDIEPFYFSSSIGWTPSRFQDSLDTQLKSDRITVTLRFVRKIAKPARDDYMTSDKTRLSERSAIDVHKPLPLGSNDSALQPDLLAFHMIRSKYDNTIISYHCNEEHGSTSAADLCARLQLVGRSVYWGKLFQEYRDATFVLVSLLWYALYSWDEAIEGLYDKIRKLEARVMKTLDPFEMTDIMNNLHTIRAHMLFYNSLLADFQKAVVFVKNTPNPALAGAANKEQARSAIEKECNHILRGISRIEKDCQMQDMRLRNATNLGYSRSNIYDSRQTTKLTEAQVRDSAAMRQISYLTMVFLPAILYLASTWMRSTPELKPRLWTYIVSTVSMTILTVWLVGALQLPYMAFDVNAAAAQEAKKNGGHKLFSRLGWPIILIQTSLTDKAENRRMRGLEYE